MEACFKEQQELCMDHIIVYSRTAAWVAPSHHHIFMHPCNQVFQNGLHPVNHASLRQESVHTYDTNENSVSRAGRQATAVMSCCGMCMVEQCRQGVQKLWDKQHARGCLLTFSSWLACTADALKSCWYSSFGKS